MMLLEATGNSWMEEASHHTAAAKIGSQAYQNDCTTQPCTAELFYYYFEVCVQGIERSRLGRGKRWFMKAWRDMWARHRRAGIARLRRPHVAGSVNAIDGDAGGGKTEITAWATPMRRCQTGCRVRGTDWGTRTRPNRDRRETYILLHTI